MSQSFLLFGGSFDPVHRGHLHIVEQALAQLPPMDRILFIPSRQSPGKHHPLAVPDLRIQFLELALSGTSFQVSTVEIERQGPSYTIETLRGFRADFPSAKLFWLMGADAYANFSSWREPDEIRRLATLAIVGRPKQDLVVQSPDDLALSIPLSPWSSSDLRKELAKGLIPPHAFPKSLEQHLKNLLLKGQNPYASL